MSVMKNKNRRNNNVGYVCNEIIDVANVNTNTGGTNTEQRKCTRQRNKENCFVFFPDFLLVRQGLLPLSDVCLNVISNKGTFTRRQYCYGNTVV